MLIQCIRTQIDMMVCKMTVWCDFYLTGEQVLIAYGLPKSMFTEDNELIKETFTDVKSYLCDVTRR